MSVQYSSQKNFNHSSPQKIGILLVNLGTPDAPNTKSLKKYLKQFLSDPRVIELPRFFWFFILNFIVLPQIFSVILIDKFQVSNAKLRTNLVKNRSTVVAEYCGYIGKTSNFLQFCSFNFSRASLMEGL